MSAPILATKLYIPPIRPQLILRSRLIARLNEGLQGKLTLISAPAGFGKTTILSEWLVNCGRPIAWLSLDEGDNEFKRFLSYLIAALQKIAPQVGSSVLALLQAAQMPPIETVLTIFLNEIASIPDNFVLVLDDYHLIDNKQIDELLNFLLDYLPPQMHLLIASREDPQLSLARLRARNQLNELRIADLRFSHDEATGFLNQVMRLNLSAEAISALETRTEGWIAGLQLAAISMQGHPEPNNFIKAFTGSHHFVLDYLLEEVLQQQSEEIQTFLLETAILERLSAPLCDALLLNAASSSQAILEYIERANLFIIPLDNERRWYRYHHLFGDLLRQRLGQMNTVNIAELHIRASQWYEENGFELEAFHHATSANDIDRAIRLIEAKGMPLPFRGAVMPVLNWLESLPKALLDARPLLWAWYASTALASGQGIGIEEKLQSAELALEKLIPDESTEDLIGRIAAVRATLAVSQHNLEIIVEQSRRALDYLAANNLAFRTSTIWKLGYAYQLQGKRLDAAQTYQEAIAIGQVSKNKLFTATATMGLGNIQETENQLFLAAETYQNSIDLFGDYPLPIICEAYMGLARIHYEWNRLDKAQEYAQESAKFSSLLMNMDRFVAYEIFLARLSLIQGDIREAERLLAKAAQAIQQNKFMNELPNLIPMQVLILIEQGNLKAAEQLAETHKVVLSQARVKLAQGDYAGALLILEPLHQEMEAKAWAYELFKTMLLELMALYQLGKKQKAIQLLDDALKLAEVGGFIRSFIDEGIIMAHILSEAKSSGIRAIYLDKLLVAFSAEEKSQNLIEALSERELEVLLLIAQGFSNQEISEKLFLALSTIKGHNQSIFGKLGVQRRTEAVARARELGIIV